jgi:IS605 OrfB family transposase
MTATPSRQKAARDDKALKGLKTLVLRLRVKDKHDGFLSARARQVNFVWNFCNEHSFKVLQREQRFVSAYDLHPFLKGAGKEGLDLHSQTLQAIAEEYVLRRRQFKKAKLRWRVSSGSRRSLGWIPFKSSAISYRSGQVWFDGQAISLWDSYGLADYDLGSGSFSQDARGRWYFNVSVTAHSWPKSRELAQVKKQAIGIDLGLKSLMSDSDGNTVEAQRFYRGLEPQLAAAQRARKPERVRAIHAKIANRRKDFAHKLSTSQVALYQAIFVGDVNAQALTQTNMAKSVLDAGWAAYRTMLRYKCDNAGVWYADINERYSTQECNRCHERTGPKGLEGLSIRTWTCSHCGAVHERDTNSSEVIKQRGLEWLESEFTAEDSVAICDMADVNKDSGAVGSMARVGHDPLVVGISVL